MTSVAVPCQTFHRAAITVTGLTRQHSQSPMHVDMRRLPSQYVPFIFVVSGTGSFFSGVRSHAGRHTAGSECVQRRFDVHRAGQWRVPGDGNTAVSGWASKASIRCQPRPQGSLRRARRHTVVPACNVRRQRTGSSTRSTSPARLSLAGIPVGDHLSTVAGQPEIFSLAALGRSMTMALIRSRGDSRRTISRPPALRCRGHADRTRSPNPADNARQRSLSSARRRSR